MDGGGGVIVKNKKYDMMEKENTMVKMRMPRERKGREARGRVV
jgi:hypothetical protein